MDPYYGPKTKKADAGIIEEGELPQDADYWRRLAMKYQREAIEARTKLEVTIQGLEALARNEEA